MASSEPTLLAFDTSAAHCAAALLAGGRIVAESCEQMARGQAERLMGLLSETLAAGGMAWRDLDAVAVGTGPGNFTGIRISVSAARGLALGRDMPAIGVTGFEILADTLSLETPTLLSLPAPRGSVYLQHFDGKAIIGTPWQSDPDGVSLDGSAMPAQIAGAEAERIARTLGGVAWQAQEIDWSTATGFLARRAARKLGAAVIDRPAPLYIRPADAAPAATQPPVLLK